MAECIPKPGEVRNTAGYFPSCDPRNQPAPKPPQKGYRKAKPSPWVKGERRMRRKTERRALRQGGTLTSAGGGPSGGSVMPAPPPRRTFGNAPTR